MKLEYVCLATLLVAGCSAEAGNPPPDQNATSTGGASAAGAGGAQGGFPMAVGGAVPGAGGAGPGAGGAVPGAGGAMPSAPDKGCGTTTLLGVPEDPGVRGPWKVGVRTVKIGRLTTEIVYPAEPGSEAGKPETTYDIRDWLPPSEYSKVPAEASPAVTPIGGNLFRDVPIDAAHGPYPVVVYIHGTSSFRIAGGSALVHWASRGFIVLGADYPGLMLADALCDKGFRGNPTMSNTGGPPTPLCDCEMSGTKDIAGDVQTQLTAMKAPAGELAFLAGHADMTRIGISGHSQGACMSASLSTLENVQVVIPMTGSLQVIPAPSLKSVMFIAGINDTVIGYNEGKFGNVVCPPVAPQEVATSNTVAYQKSPGAPGVKKRLVGITGGGHLVPTDLCQNNAQGFNAITEAQKDGVCGIDQAVVLGLPSIFDCGTISMPAGVHAVSYASTAALEETLHCKDRSAAFAGIKTAVPEIGEFLQE